MVVEPRNHSSVASSKASRVFQGAQLGFVQPVDRLGQRVVVAVTNESDRPLSAELGEAFAVAHRCGQSPPRRRVIDDHAASLVAPPNEASWASLTVWAPGAVLRGFRIPNEGGPGHVGVRVHTGSVEIDDVMFEGGMAVGVDAGPRVSMRVKDNIRMHLDWRQRLAGEALPDSGPALTLAADF